MERLLEKQKRNLKAKAIKYHDDPQRKKQAIKKRYEDEKESIKQNKKKILRCTWYMENADTMKIQRTKYQKARHQENPENKLPKKEVLRKS